MPNHNSTNNKMVDRLKLKIDGETLKCGLKYKALNQAYNSS
eukprot:gene19580-25483_t